MTKALSDMMDFPAEPGIPRDVSRLLIVGGSFDPPHRAHIDLSMQAAEKLRCEHVVFIPAARSPHKETDPTPAKHRVAMLSLALEGMANVSISRFEVDREPPSYTVETLRSLKSAAGSACALFLLMGSDQARSFARWREPEEILNLVTPAVMLRPPDTRETLGDRWASWVVDLPLMTVSATAVRAMFERGEELGEEPGGDVLCSQVLGYIRENGLYRGTGC